MPRPNLLARAVGTALLLAACSGGDEPVAAPSPTTPAVAPSPTETELPPLVGERTVLATIVSHEHLLTHQESPAADEDGINVLLGRTAQLLDDHLNDLNDGGDGLLTELVADGLFPTAADADLLTTDLASPAVPAVSARYELDVAYGGAPRWIRVRMEVDRDDATTRAIDLVLTADLPQQIIAAGEAA